MKTVVFANSVDLDEAVRYESPLMYQHYLPYTVKK